MYKEIAGTDERVRVIPGVRDKRDRATKVRLYLKLMVFQTEFFKKDDFEINQQTTKKKHAKLLTRQSYGLLESMNTKDMIVQCPFSGKPLLAKGA